MSNLELVLNMLAEATTTEISKEKKPKNFIESKIIAKQVVQLQAIPEKKLRKKQVKVL